MKLTDESLLIAYQCLHTCRTMPCREGLLPRILKASEEISAELERRRKDGISVNDGNMVFTKR